MAEPFKFKGCNHVFKGDGGAVQDLDVFVSEGVVASAWRLMPGELEEIIRTGVVMVVVRGHMVPPFAVGTNGSLRPFAAKYGEVWPVEVVEK